MSERGKQADGGMSASRPATPEFALQRCREVLVLHKELAPVCDSAAQRLVEYGDTAELAEKYRSMADWHRKAADYIETHILDERGNLR